jgi:tetratricopeptide (TPR) repeat protein
MKKTGCAFILIFLMMSGVSFAGESVKEADQLFYKANAYYESRDYTKAIESYVSVLDKGIESGNLYYNIGNSFFKLGKIGYAILCYNRASRLMPRDSDVKANLEYARAMIDDPACATFSTSTIAKAIRLPYRAFNLSTLTILTAAIYLVVAALLAASIISHKIGRKLRYLTAFFVIMFLSSVTAFSMRYYDEVILKHGIVIQKNVDCKYEPIDKSTTYYKLGEGCEVIILSTKNDWRQVRRSDGKIAWVKKEAVEPI